MEESTPEQTTVKVNKPWKNESFHMDYNSADSRRNHLINIWKDSKEHDGMQAKVKFMRSKGQFVVKIRLHPDFETTNKVKVKNAKRSKKNKRNNESRLFDPQASA